MNATWRTGFFPGGDHTLYQVKSVAVAEWLDNIKRAKGARAKFETS
jgi:hypothetical protein